MSQNNIAFFPPVNVSLAESGTLQKYLDNLGPSDGSVSGGVLQLPRGNFYGDLIVRYPYTRVRGMGNGTRIIGKVLCPVGYCTFEDMWINPPAGSQYGLRLSATVSGQGAAGVPRCDLKGLYIGGVQVGGSDGPVNGLELDGAILTEAHHCIFASCSGSGVNVDTTQTGPGPAGAFSTNVNRFRGCTMNNNGQYGVFCPAGAPAAVDQLEIYGGNMESNGLGAIKADSVTGLYVEGTDFETDGNVTPITNFIDLTLCNPVVITRCNFAGTHDGYVRAWILSSCSGGEVTYNRGNGSHWLLDNSSAWGVIDENCVDIRDFPNVTADVIGSARAHTENRCRRY